MLRAIVAFLAASAVEAVPLLDHQLLPRQWQPWSSSSSPASSKPTGITVTSSYSSVSKTLTPVPTSAKSTQSGLNSVSSSRTSISSAVYTSKTPAVSSKPLGSSSGRSSDHAANTACAVVSAASESYLEAYPKATAAIVDASDAVNCLNSIPIIQEDATRLLASLRTYCEFQSDKEYLKNPPDGYTNPAHDFDAEFNRIQANIDSGSYNSEVEFQIDIDNAISQAFDGHFYWQGDILRGVFSFRLNMPAPAGLASVSTDGVQDPQIYFTRDLVEVTGVDGTSFKLQQHYKPSPVTKLNGIDISEAIEILSLSNPSQDPDTRYNSQFYIQGRTSNPAGAFIYKKLPPRDVFSYNFAFANGSSTTLPIVATVLGDFTDVTDGISAYETFALFNNEYQETDEEGSNGNETATSTMSTSTATSRTASPTATTTASASATATILPNIPGFPYPIVKDDSNLIAGYFLNGTGFEDVAVLQIVSFLPEVITETYLEDAQDALSYFLARAKSSKKTKLIIDVQGNGGGSIDLGSDIFVQLFPNLEPNQSGNIRRSAGMDVIIETASNNVAKVGADEVTQDALARRFTPFDVEYTVTPDNVNIETADDLLDGITYGGAKFTEFFQTNYTDPNAFMSTDFNITMADPDAKPVFAPENVVLLTDGTCASSCTVFAERLKNLVGSIPFIVAGGRPNHGPVQAIGGIKGSQIFNYQVIGLTMLPLFNNASSAALAPLNGTEWDYFDEYPIARTAGAVRAGSIVGGLSGGGVNGRNSFRIGDTTNTPLQYVYEAADCRIWYTTEMLNDPTVLWNRVAEVAFTPRNGMAYTSKYCVARSTGHPTAVTGGWKKGTLGPQGQGLIERKSPIFASAPWA